MPEGLVTSFEDAVLAADTEMGEATPVAPDSDLPSDVEEVFVSEDQAPEEAIEQPADAEASATDEVFNEDLVEAPDTPEAPVLTEESVVEVAGVEQPVTLRELKDGYMRQADYTRKTQEVAADRKQHEDAVKFWDAIQANPTEVIRSLAEKVGIPVDGDVRDIEVSPFKTAAEVEAEIARQVEEKVQEHPSVREARYAEAQRVIDDEFARIERENNIQLGPKSRETILQEVNRTGANDLEVVFHALMAKKRQRAAQTDEIRRAAPSSPTGGSSDDTGLPKRVDSFGDAAALALAELEG